MCSSLAQPYVACETWKLKKKKKADWRGCYVSINCKCDLSMLVWLALLVLRACLPTHYSTVCHCAPAQPHVVHLPAVWIFFNKNVICCPTAGFGINLKTESKIIYYYFIYFSLHVECSYSMGSEMWGGSLLRQCFKGYCAIKNEVELKIRKWNRKVKGSEAVCYMYM